MTCLIPFAAANFLKVSDVNCGPLSDTIWSGSPMRAKQRAQCANGFFSSGVLHHKNLRPLAMSINDHHEHLSLDLPGKGRVLPPMQGCMGRVIRQFLATLTASGCPFNVFVNVGPPNEARDKPFILTMPRCPLWSVSNTLSLSLAGTTTLLPHIRTP